MAKKQVPLDIAYVLRHKRMLTETFKAPDNIECIVKEMSETEVTEKSRDLVLAYLKSKYSEWSERMRNLPNFIFNDPETLDTIMLSPNDVLQEVAATSDLGKKIIKAELQKLSRLQP